MGGVSFAFCSDGMTANFITTADFIELYDDLLKEKGNAKVYNAKVGNASAKVDKLSDLLSFVKGFNSGIEVCSKRLRKVLK